VCHLGAVETRIEGPVRVVPHHGEILVAVGIRRASDDNFAIALDRDALTEITRVADGGCDLAGAVEIRVEAAVGV